MEGPKTLPSIDAGTATNLENINPKDRIIIQEKVDGSQFTVVRQGIEVMYFNKHKKKDPRGNPFRNSWLYLQGKTHFLKEGLSYHGEAMQAKRANTVVYERCPFWVIYEIVRQDGTILTPEEMEEVLAGTPFETTQILYDSKRDGPPENIQGVVDDILARIESGEIKSSLGGQPEGIVLKVLNRKQRGKIVTSRFKFVRHEFKEANQTKKNRLPEVSDEDFIQELGDIYNTDARLQKGVQHMKEDGTWKDNIDKNIHGMVDELDKDLLDEEMEEIKTMLFIRFWPAISKAARGNLREFLNKNYKE
jgi:RNA ligase